MTSAFLSFSFNSCGSFSFTILRPKLLLKVAVAVKLLTLLLVIICYHIILAEARKVKLEANHRHRGILGCSGRAVFKLPCLHSGHNKIANSNKKHQTTILTVHHSSPFCLKTCCTASYWKQFENCISILETDLIAETTLRTARTGVDPVKGTERAPARLPLSSLSPLSTWHAVKRLLGTSHDMGVGDNPWSICQTLADSGVQYWHWQSEPINADLSWQHLQWCLMF